MSKKKIITLLTDFGLKDPFVGIMKGVIYGINPDACIVDLTHEISCQDIFEGSFALYQSYNFFPPGTVHIIVVDPGVGGQRKNLIFETGKFMFVAPDNGVVSLAIEKEKDNLKIFEITNDRYLLKDVSNTFHGRDIFAPAGAHLSGGVRPEKIGGRIQEYKKINIPGIIKKGNQALATVIHIDKFGNLITNVDKSLNDKIKCIHIKKNIISRISNSYEEGSTSEALAIYGSANFLEISINNENAAEILGIQKGDTIPLDLNST